MVFRSPRLLALAFSALLLSQGSLQAAGVKPLFDLGSPDRSPFPSDRFTVRDSSQNTRVRVNLPKPDCAVRASDCADIDVINTLDGFNLQPRVSIPFSGAIDVASVNSDNVFLVNLGDARDGDDDDRDRGRRGRGGRTVGVNQILFDAATNTLHVESDQLLDQHSRYALIVTNGIRDTVGDPIEVGDFARFRRDLNFGQTRDPQLKSYRKALLEALEAADLDDDDDRRGGERRRVVAASVFSTLSATADMEKIRNQIKASNPAPATFAIGAAGERAVFPLASVASISFSRQVGTAPAFSTSALPVFALGLIPGSVGAVAFGKFSSPDYETTAKYIPAVGTRTGTPVVQGTNDIFFNLFLPSGPRPAGGWPVAIYGHGFTDSKNGSPFVLASVMASRGIALLAINVVGHGGGALGSMTIGRNGGLAPVTIPAGGRGIDQDGNGAIDSTEGSNAAPPRSIIGSRDSLRQTVVDLMQMVRVIQVGVDIDGNGSADLDASRIYYFGQSFGGIYGTQFLAVEPDVRAGVPNVAGGSIAEVARLGGFRFLTAIALATRAPQLLNLPPTPGVPPPFNLNFNENIPLRDQAPVVNLVPGAMAIQKVLENNEWVSQAGNPVAYAPHIRKAPLAGMWARPVIFQFSRGDQTVPNPTNTAIIRAGDLADRTTFYRNDLAFALNPATPKNPHTILTNVFNPAVAAYAIMAQQQIATFFASDGTLTIDPDGAGAIFETPIAQPLPETLNYIP